MTRTERRRPRLLTMKALHLWHAGLAGGFLVAYLTGDEDTYAMHLFSGYWVLALLAFRGLAAILAQPGSPWRLLGTPNRKTSLRWMAAVLLGALTLTAVSGWLADGWTWMEDPHEAVAEAMPWLIAGHVGLVLLLFPGRRLLAPLAGLLALLGLSGQAQAEPARDAILQTYARQAEQPFSAARGEALFRSRNAATPETPSCTSCHTEDPRAMGRNAKTGRPIDPVAVSANPRRFTDAAEVEKRFGRDCKAVLGRACTAQEKGDYITFMESR